MLCGVGHKKDCKARGFVVYPSTLQLTLRRSGRSFDFGCFASDAQDERQFPLSGCGRGEGEGWPFDSAAGAATLTANG
jgi:hypothetical protein